MQLKKGHFVDRIWVKIVVVLAVLSTLMHAQGCWSLEDTGDIEFSELDEVIVFSLRDATNCTPVANVSVNFGGVKLTTDAHGEFSVPLGVLKEGQRIKTLFIKEGYISLLKTFNVEANTIREKKILLSPKTKAGQARFVLSWQDKPLDMDAHLVSDDFHISYRNTKSINNVAKLDKDARKGFGPETITLSRIKPDIAYTFFAHQFSRDGQINDDVRVDLYIDNKFKGTYRLPSTKSRTVKVLRITQEDVASILEPVDTIAP